MAGSTPPTTAPAAAGGPARPAVRSGTRAIGLIPAGGSARLLAFVIAAVPLVVGLLATGAL